MARGRLSQNQTQSGLITGGRVSKTTSSHGGTTKKPRANRKPYKLALYRAIETLYFAKTDGWKAGCLDPGIKKIIFGGDFGINDTHIDALVAAGPSTCHSLRHIQCGDTDSGNGAGLTDASITRLASACPNLIHVSLEASTSLTDSALLALVTKCPDLQYVQISGNDKVPGKVIGPALERMGEEASLGTKLQKLRLTDQGNYDSKFKKMVKNLSAKRKKLAIEVGEVCERGIGVNTWLRGKEKTGYQALGGPGGFSQFGGF